jgi:hypothetical protein
MSYKASSNQKRPQAIRLLPELNLNRPITLFCARTYNTAKANVLREIDFDAVEAPEILSLHLGENQD